MLKNLLLFFIVLGLNQLSASESIFSKAIGYIKSTSVFNPIVYAVRVYSDDNYLTKFLGDAPNKLVNNLKDNSKCGTNLNDQLLNIGVSFTNVPLGIWSDLQSNIPFHLHDPHRRPYRISLSLVITICSLSYCVSYFDRIVSFHNKKNIGDKSSSGLLFSTMKEKTLFLISFLVGSTLLCSGCSIDYLNRKVVSSLIKEAQKINISSTGN